MNKNQQERERLKQIYKDHYRQIREFKEQYQQQRRKISMMNALKDMDNNELMNTLNEFTDRIKSRIAQAEARLEVALEDMDSEQDMPEEQGQGHAAQRQGSAKDADDELREEKARKNLKRIKQEMGELYNELEEQARNMNVEKTVGSSSNKSSPDSDRTSNNEG